MGAGTPPLGVPSPPEAYLPPTPGQPFPLALLGWAPSNITFTLLFGRRFEYQDPVFVSLLSLIDEVMVLLGTPSLQVRGGYSQPRGGGWSQHCACPREVSCQLAKAVLHSEPGGPRYGLLLTRIGHGTPGQSLRPLGNEGGVGQGARLPPPTPAHQ